MVKEILYETVVDVGRVSDRVRVKKLSRCCDLDGVRMKSCVSLRRRRG